MISIDLAVHAMVGTRELSQVGEEYIKLRRKRHTKAQENDADLARDSLHRSPIFYQHVPNVSAIECRWTRTRSGNLTSQ